MLNPTPQPITVVFVAGFFILCSFEWVASFGVKIGKESVDQLEEKLGRHFGVTVAILERTLTAAVDHLFN